MSYVKLIDPISKKKVNTQLLVKQLIDKKCDAFIFIPGVEMAIGKIPIPKLRDALSDLYVNAADKGLSKGQRKIKGIFLERWRILDSIRELYATLKIRCLDEGQNSKSLFGLICSCILSKDSSVPIELIKDLYNNCTQFKYGLSEPMSPEIEKRMDAAKQMASILVSSDSNSFIRNLVVNMAKKEGVYDLVLYLEDHHELSITAFESASKNSNLAKEDVLDKLSDNALNYFIINANVENYCAEFLKCFPDHEIVKASEEELSISLSEGFETIRYADLCVICRNQECKISYFDRSLGEYKKISRKEDIKCYSVSDLYVLSEECNKERPRAGEKLLTLIGERVKKLIELAKSSGINIEVDNMPGTKIEFYELLVKYEILKPRAESTVKDYFKGVFTFKRGVRKGKDNRINALNSFLSELKTNDNNQEVFIKL